MMLRNMGARLAQKLIPKTRTILARSAHFIPKSLLTKPSKRVVTVIAGGAAVTGAGLYHAYHAETEQKPITYAKLLYTILYSDDSEQRRRNGIVPEKLYKAAKLAIAENNHELAHYWLVKLTLVAPTPAEIPLYKEAALYLQTHQFFNVANKIYRLTLSASELEVIEDMAHDRFENTRRGLLATSFWTKTGGSYFTACPMMVRMSHDYLTSRESTTIDSAQEKLRLARDTLLTVHTLDPDNAMVLNELGVVYFMEAISWLNPSAAWLGSKTFYEMRADAIDCLQRAAKLNPGHPVIDRNLEMVRLLEENQVNYGMPWLHLKTQCGEYTFLYEAILASLAEKEREPLFAVPSDYDYHTQLISSQVLSQVKKLKQTWDKNNEADAALCELTSPHLKP